MAAALVLVDDASVIPRLVEDLNGSGIPVLGACDCNTLVHRVIQAAPDVLIAWSDRPNAQLFEALETLSQVSPCPVVLFTQYDDVEAIERGVACGVDAYVIAGYSSQRLRSLIHVARARFRTAQALRSELAELTSRLEERRLVDRAKGILMRDRRFTEEEAFRTLRSASQRGNRRVGEVAGRLIEAARAAEAVNRAGQLRMLSQRIVKLQALIAARIEEAGASALLAQSCARARSNLEVLENLVSQATYGDLLAHVRRSWAGLEAMLDANAAAADLVSLDARAEELSADADRLVTALGGADPTSGLHVVNVCGRQRMLSQRLAKLALLGGLIDSRRGVDAREAAVATALEFESALAFLAASASPAAGAARRLEEATSAWNRMQAAVRTADNAAGRLQIAAASEAVLDSFEQLTDQLERSLHVLLGPAAPRN